LGLLLALGGGALGGIAVGGAAIGAIAFGGAAIGYYAYGGGAWGVHAYGGNAQDPVAKQFFESLPVGTDDVINAMSMFGISVGFVALLVWLVVLMRYFFKAIKQKT
jgi:hypothetical protein